MGKWFKDNWFRLGILIVGISLATAVFIMLFHQRPSEYPTPITRDNPIDVENSQPTAYPSPVASDTSAKLIQCIDAANAEFNYVVNMLQIDVQNGKLDSKYFSPSIDALEIRKEEQKQDCAIKYK